MTMSWTSRGVPRNSQTYPEAIIDMTLLFDRCARAMTRPSASPIEMDAAVSQSVARAPPRRYGLPRYSRNPDPLQPCTSLSRVLRPEAEASAWGRVRCGSHVWSVHREWLGVGGDAIGS